MDKYEASNGMEIERLREGVYSFAGYGAGFTSDEWSALREFFRAERDEELGRWRYPKDPQFVVYPGFSPGENSRVARVVHEHVGTSTLVYEKPGIGRTSHPAATAYFEAHPERKPWHDAKEGEVWIVTPSKALALGEKAEYPAIFQAGMFRDHGGSWGAADLTAARRIWPEEP